MLFNYFDELKRMIPWSSPLLPEARLARVSVNVNGRNELPAIQKRRSWAQLAESYIRPNIPLPNCCGVSPEKSAYVRRFRSDNAPTGSNPLTTLSVLGGPLAGTRDHGTTDQARAIR